LEEKTMNNQNINVVVTGAARGLGAALSLGLSDLGCNVILCGRSPAALDVTADQIESRTGRRPQEFMLDLADTARVESAAKEIVERFPVIDVLINNGAAWLGERTPYEAAPVCVNSALTARFFLPRR
jgi:NAD(P)-dependent dehydrogenase (short-subunit alcohol dehydrogenase family)